MRVFLAIFLILFPSLAFAAQWSNSTTGSAATTLAAAPAAGRWYIQGVQCGRDDAGTAAIDVTLDDTASTLLVLPNSGGGGGNNQSYNPPLAVAPLTAFTFTPSAGVTTTRCNAQGYNAP